MSHHKLFANIPSLPLVLLIVFSQSSPTVRFVTTGEDRNKGLDTRIGKANAILRELYCSAVTKRELSKNAQLSVFKSVFVSILTSGHES